MKERSLGIETTIGLRGVCSVGEIVSHDPLEMIILRPVKLEDIPETVAVRDNGLGDFDRTNRPYLPDLTGILKIYLKQFSVRRDDMTFIYVKQWDPNTAFDLVLSGINMETYRFMDLLYLFQSKQFPKMKGWKVSFFLKNLSKSAIYVREIQLKEEIESEIQPFAFKKEFQIPFQNFCNKMRPADFIDRIFQYSKVRLSHTEMPLEIAYKRYLKLLGQNTDVYQNIHDTVEALEAFFLHQKNPKRRLNFLSITRFS